MPPSTRRILPLPAVSLLLLAAACGGKSATAPAAPSPLELACGVSMSGPDAVLTVVGRARPSAGAGAAPIAVNLAHPTGTEVLTLSPPGWIGQAEFRPSGGTTYMPITGTATIDGKAVTVFCSATERLPAFAVHAAATAGGADLAWDAVSGAVRYRWTLREGTTGPVIATAETNATSASATNTLTPGGNYLVEVGAYRLPATLDPLTTTPLVVPATSFARSPLSAGRSGGDGRSAWQLFSPGDFVAGTLTVAYPNLLADERLAVLLVNAGGADRSNVTVSVVGTGLPTVASVKPGVLALDPGGAPAVHDEGLGLAGARGGEALVMKLRDETARRLRDGTLQRVVPEAAARAMGAKGRNAALAPAPLPATRSFCQFRDTNASANSVAYYRSATLAFETAHAGFYYTDEVKAGVDTAVATRALDPALPVGVAPFWGELGAAFEAKIYPALTTYFGEPSDVDVNGKVIFLLANLGSQGGSYTMGYFWSGDLDLPLVNATSCSRFAGGNQSDMLYLMDPANFASFSGVSGPNYAVGLKSLVESEYPSVMAHELQHNVNYITRCPLGAACGVDEELWLNEGLSMLSMTVAGYGLHDAGGRADVRYYQGEVETASGLPFHRAYSLTAWEGNPLGNYAGVAAYMQYLADHATPAVTRALENPRLAGKANIEAATGIPWEVGFAHFVTAAVFSNEDQAEPNSGGAGLITSTGNQLAQPQFNFLGSGIDPDYVPWHHYTGNCTTGGVKYPKPRLARVAYVPLASSAIVPLRIDGWTALATGPGGGGPATVTVQSAATLKPHVVLVKYSGALPSYAPIDTTCP